MGRTDGRTARLYFSALSPLSPRSSIVSTCGTRRRAINGENIYTTPCVDVKAAPLESPRDDRLIARGGGGGGGDGCCCVAGGLLCLAHRRRPDDRRCVASVRRRAARHIRRVGDGGVHAQLLAPECYRSLARCRQQKSSIHRRPSTTRSWTALTGTRLTVHRHQHHRRRSFHLITPTRRATLHCVSGSLQRR